MLAQRAVVQGAVLRCAACDGWEMLRAGLRGGCACLGSRLCVLIARGRRRAGLRGGHDGPFCNPRRVFFSSSLSIYTQSDTQLDSLMHIDV